MKRVGVREFRDHATAYLAGEDVLTIERHGTPIGIYIPTAGKKRADLRKALDELDAAVKQVIEEQGITEETLSRYFDWKQPLDDVAEGEDHETKHASRR